MRKYIERETVLSNLHNHYPKPGDMIASVVTIPAVDAVPVVVCSKCKYDGACVTQSFIESEGVLPFDRDTWFCADGERKGGDE